MPGIGTIADGLNLAISIKRGNLIDSVFSAIAIAPVIGSAISGSFKIIYHAIDKVDEVMGSIKKAIKKHGDEAASCVDDVAEGVAEGASRFIDPKLMDELAESGEKFTEDAVEMVTKNTDGKLLWLETGSESAGLTHIMKHEKDLLAKGVDVTDIPGFIKNDLLTQAPTRVGRNAKGPYAECLVDGNKFILAYGDNGFIVSLYPMK